VAVAARKNEMPPRKRAQHVVVAALLGALLAVANGSVAGPLRVGDPAVAAGESVAPQNDRAFGYEVGEERRYVLEPESSLRTGESAWWSIVLEGIDGEGDDVHMTFLLEHQRSELIRDVFGGMSGRMQVVDIEARLVVNRFGFPEQVVIQEQTDVSGEMGSLSDVRTTIFNFDGERMVKQIRIDGRVWDFNIAIASSDDLDVEVPSGMYAWVPTALRCLGAPGEIGRPYRCDTGDPAFANPGLLSLALPVMWEEQVNEKKFLFFTPTGVGTLPGGLMDMNRLMRRERDTLANYQRYFNEKELTVKEFVPGAEIGPRSVDAWLLDGSGELREIWAEPDGRVLKVNLDPHPVTRGSRWIRLQFPSEY